MSAGPDELHLREFQEVSEPISDPLQAFFEEVQAMAEVSKGQKEASIVPVLMKGSKGTCSPVNSEAPWQKKQVPHQELQMSIMWEKQEIIQSSAQQRLLSCSIIPHCDHCT